MPLYSTLAALSQTPASNPPDGSVDLPSTVDDQLRFLGSFIAQLRDGKGITGEVDVASGATCDIGAANSPFVRVTGTTNITSFGTNYNGPRFLRFTGLLSLSNSSTLVLPGGATIAVQVGDSCIAVPMTGGGWRVTQYQRAATAPDIGRLLGVRVITTSGTYTATTGTSSVIVDVVGGGGAGGGAVATSAGQVAAGGGGGAGGYARSRLTSAFSGVSVTVGAGGAGSAGGNGGNGGSSSFGALLSATGGTGGSVGAPGLSSSVFPGGVSPGGTGSSGNVYNAAGGQGSYALYSSTPLSGAGGASQFGAGGVSLVGVTSAGANATSYGAGGSGACLQPSSGTNGGGGSGMQGVVVVYEYA